MERTNIAKHLAFGAAAESWAERFLARKGFRILGRNVRFRGGEIDIVAMDGDELVVVEVRARHIGEMLPPVETVGPMKLRKLVRAGRVYVEKSGFEGNWRIDVVALTIASNGEKKVEHIRDATYGMEVF